MNRTFALAALLAAPSTALAAKTEAILAFSEGGSEAIRYYAQKGAARSALSGEPEKLKVDAVKNSPVVTAILVTFPGSAAPDRDEAQARLFAFGDTVNARVRQASGGKRSIMGDVVGPVTIAASSSCDLLQLYKQAAAQAKADLSETDVALILAPKSACRYSGAATLGRIASGKRRMAVAWAFGDAWVASAAHALEHTMGTRHAANPAAEDFGWTTAAAPASKARSIARKPAKRGATVAKAGKGKDALLTLASVFPMLDTPAQVPQGGFRDAPAAIRVGPALGYRPQAGAVANRVIEDSLSRRGELRPLEVPASTDRSAKFHPIDAAACREGVRNLRDALKAAGNPTSRASALIARRRLADTLKHTEQALSGKDVPEDAEVSLLTTDAESELHFAIMKIEDPKLSLKSLKNDVIPAVERAANSLGDAAYRLSVRR